MILMQNIITVQLDNCQYNRTPSDYCTQISPWLSRYVWPGKLKKNNNIVGEWVSEYVSDDIVTAKIVI